MGLAKSIVRGVSKILKTYERVIVLEDDILVAHGFLCFMNQALERYDGCNEVFSVSGYVANDVSDEIQRMFGPSSAVFVPRSNSWGWATWRSAWQDAAWFYQPPVKIANEMTWPLNICGNDISNMLELQKRGLIDSWAVRWAAHHFIK